MFLKFNLPGITAKLLGVGIKETLIYLHMCGHFMVTRLEGAIWSSNFNNSKIGYFGLQIWVGVYKWP